MSLFLQGDAVKWGWARRAGGLGAVGRRRFNKMVIEELSHMLLVCNYNIISNKGLRQLRGGGFTLHVFHRLPEPSWIRPTEIKDSLELADLGFTDSLIALISNLSE